MGGYNVRCFSLISKLTVKTEVSSPYQVSVPGKLGENLDLYHVTQNFQVISNYVSV